MGLEQISQTRIVDDTTMNEPIAWCLHEICYSHANMNAATARMPRSTSTIPSTVSPSDASDMIWPVTAAAPRKVPGRQIEVTLWPFILSLSTAWTGVELDSSIVDGRHRGLQQRLRWSGIHPWRYLVPYTLKKIRLFHLAPTQSINVKCIKYATVNNKLPTGLLKMLCKDNMQNPLWYSIYKYCSLNLVLPRTQLCIVTCTHPSWSGQ